MPTASRAPARLRAPRPLSRDFVVIGAGSAGFNAARVAADLGRRVTLIDGAPRLGGLCILHGCMPSKTLLHAAELLHHARHAAPFGLRIPKAEVDMPALRRWKRRVIDDFAGYREKALQSGRYEVLRHHAHFVDAQTLQLDDGRQVRARHILIATGSRPATPPLPGLAETPHWHSDTVLDLAAVPRSVLVLGGGVVACELAQFLARVGSRVTLLQRSLRLLRESPSEAAEVVRQAFVAEGIRVELGVKVEKLSPAPGGGVRATFLAADGRRRTVRAAHLLNALGRVPALDGLALAAAGLSPTAGGRLQTDAWQRTSVPTIYAAGDVCEQEDLVHVAVAQGELAARHASGVSEKTLHPVSARPGLHVVFTDPPVALAGRSAEALAAAGVPHLTASYPFDDHGKSILMRQTRGLVRLSCSPGDGRLLGAEIAGPQAGELIHVFTAPIQLGLTVRQLLDAPWYHPTLAEIVTYPLEELAEQLPAPGQA